MSDIRKSVKMLRTNCPGPFNELIEYIDSKEKTADEALVSALSEPVMRQNQGKTQILREILGVLRA